MDTDQTETKPVAVFACGNVLDPHIRVEGDCRACLGTGWADGDLDPSRKCEICFGTGKATALVRFTELIRTVGPALEYVTVTEEPI